jgi:NodT family efflux transporter outer membrane factor (OMF) lipoprotein
MSLAILLVGCMVGPNYVRPPVTLREEWSAAGDILLSTEHGQYKAWWKAFDDQALGRLIETAYHQNLSLQAAGVRVLEARAQLGIAIGQFYPQQQQVFWSLQYNQLSQNSILAGSSGSLKYAQDEIGVMASWELDFWGRFRRVAQSADALLYSRLADYQSALVSLTADVASAYITARTLEKRIEIASENVNTETENLRLAEAKLRGGATTARDVEQARTLLSSTLASLPLLQAQLRQTGNALSVLLGMAPASIAEVLGGPSSIPAPLGQVAVGIPSDLLRRRPDVRSAEYQAIAQGAQIGIAKADLFPAFSLNGTFSFLSTNVAGSRLVDVFSWRSRSHAVGPNAQWNVFNYGRITNNVRVQDARFQELLLNYQNLVLKAQQEVEDGLAAYLRSRERAELLARSADSAKNALELAVLQYQGGIADFTTVVTAQQALLATQDSLASSLGDTANGLVQVYRGLGGGWEVMDGFDVVSDSVKQAMAARTNWGDLLRLPNHLPPDPESKRGMRSPDW